MSRDVPCQAPRLFLFPATCGNIRHVTKRAELIASLKEMSLRERVDWAVHEFAEGNQTAFAKQLNVKREQVNRWANGKLGLDAVTAAKFERLTQTPLDLWLPPPGEWAEERIRQIQGDVREIRRLLEEREETLATAEDVQAGFESLRAAIERLARPHTGEGGQTESGP